MYTDPSGYASGSVGEQNIVVAGIAALTNTISLNAMGIINNVLGALTVTLTCVTGYIITQYILLQIANIASGTNIHYSLVDDIDSAKKIEITKHYDTDPNTIY